MLSRVFELFAQVESPLVKSQGGLGLGLRLVASLVEMHGGRVEARSGGPGQGSEFIVHLPMAPADQSSEHLPQSPASTPQEANPQRVLIVDDHVNILETISRVLRKKGHTVATAANAQEAMERVAHFQPSVVLIDIGLPDVDGFELATRLRKQSAIKQATLIALTGFADETVRVSALDAGFDHLLVKPPNFSELEAVLAARPPVKPLQAPSA